MDQSLEDLVIPAPRGETDMVMLKRFHCGRDCQHYPHVDGTPGNWMFCEGKPL